MNGRLQVTGLNCQNDLFTISLNFKIAYTLCFYDQCAPFKNFKQSHTIITVIDEIHWYNLKQ